MTALFFQKGKLTTRYNKYRLIQEIEKQASYCIEKSKKDYPEISQLQDRKNTMTYANCTNIEDEEYTNLIIFKCK